MTGFLVLAVLLNAAPTQAPWQDTVARIADQRDQLAQILGETRAGLRIRVQAREPGLLTRLQAAAPSARPTGHGLLPEIEPEPPESAGVPWENCYDLAELDEWVRRDSAAATSLAAAVASDSLPLSVAVDRYLIAAENCNRIDQHVAYHQMWQRSAMVNHGFFLGRNALYADYRTWQAWRNGQTGQAPARGARERLAAEAARERLEDDLLGFQAENGPRLETLASGARRLIVPLATDIEDENFLAVFTDSIERNWNQSAALREAGLRIEIEWTRMSATHLYPEGPLQRGASVDLAAHRKRFGAVPLVLSTGASSTHSFLGAVFLGPAPTPPRTLAHEFGHLLGFSDGYLRAYEGTLDDPRGVLLVEIGPFPESLMASPGTGRVTGGMVRRLLDGYGGGSARVRH